MFNFSNTSVASDTEELDIVSTSSADQEPNEQSQLLLNEITPEIQRKIDFLDAILQAPNKKAKREAIANAVIGLGKSEKTIKRMLKRLDEQGVATLGAGRKNKGQYLISKQWFDFIVAVYKWGQKDGSRMNRHQVYAHLIALTTEGEALRGKKYTEKFKDYPGVLEDLVAGKHPSHPTVYKVIACYLGQEQKYIRHPGSPAEGQIIQTTDGILVLTHSNQVWQIDHTKLDILLVDENNEIIGRPYITLVMDSYSGCVVGFYLGFESAGSHEVSLALRHAILPKEYGSEYGLLASWLIRGIPDYVVTDRAKEFKSEHLKLVSLQLGFQRRLRAFPSAGGLIEAIFDKINKEVLSLLPGYTGSSVEERPEEAEKSACVTLHELEKRLVRYFVDHYNLHTYGRGLAQTRIERWKTSLLVEPEKLDERRLDIALMKATRRKVEKYGCVRFKGLVYQGECLAEYEGERICLRYDQRNIIRLLVYTYATDGQPGEYIGVVKARDAEIKQLSLGELNWRKKKLREQEREIDQTILLRERLDIIEFVEEKRQSKRRRRKKAHEDHQQESNESKVVELFPQNSPMKESTQQEDASVPSSPEGDLSASITPDLPASFSEDTIGATPEYNNPVVQAPTRVKRPRKGIQDWSAFIQDR